MSVMIKELRFVCATG